MLGQTTMFFLALTFFAAGCGDTGTSDSGGGDGGSDRGSPTSCRGGCPDGQFCFNGICAIGCQSDEDCADNQYCATETDQLCHNKEVFECSSDGDCLGDQVCQQGMCAAKPEQPDNECEPSPDGKDGCGKYAVCAEQDSGNECYTLPKCGADDTCPTGQAGAVCNDGHIPNKVKICLLGLCENESNCPDEPGPAGPGGDY